MHASIHSSPCIYLLYSGQYPSIYLAWDRSSYDIRSSSDLLASWSWIRSSAWRWLVADFFSFASRYYASLLVCFPKSIENEVLSCTYCIPGNCQLWICPFDAGEANLVTFHGRYRRPTSHNCCDQYWQELGRYRQGSWHFWSYRRRGTRIDSKQ